MTVALFAALLVVGLTLLVVTAARVLLGGIADSPGRTKSARAVSSGSPRRVLDERYAAGELSTEEYRHRRRVLDEGR